MPVLSDVILLISILLGKPKYCWSFDEKLVLVYFLNDFVLSLYWKASLLSDTAHNLLSFPMLGYTLAVDLKMENKTLELISELDSILVSRGGKIYLTKDALMPEAVFKKTYTQWEVFESIREKYGAIGHFASNQSKRLGLKWKKFL